VQWSRDFRYRYRMRLICILTVTLLAATVSADPRSLPFEIVNVLPNTQQVLVYDRAHNTHVLLAAGSNFEDYLVVEIKGIGVTMESQQERFTVYPRAAKGLALYLDEASSNNRPPAVYSQVEPAVAPVQVAETAADPQQGVAVALASLFSAWVTSLFA
jgi:hypothetical protein